MKPIIGLTAAIAVAVAAAAMLRHRGTEDHLFDVGDPIVYRATQRVAARCGGDLGDRRAAAVGGLPGDVRTLASGRRITVPPGSYWMVAAGKACDSRLVGPIPYTQVERRD